MAKEQLIALEIHDATLWEPSRVLPIIETMEAWGYNALVLHQNDLLDVCTQLGLTANYGVSDLRLKKVRNNAAWLNRLTDRLGNFGARLFLEIKEPSFHDYALEFRPGLLGSDGQPDPTLSAWADFCTDKTVDLLERVPDLGGLIVNLSSPESRVSMPDHIETHGGGSDNGAWFDRMIAAFEEPLLPRSKTLFIRDFSYTPDVQSDVIAAINRRQGKVHASVKITAHDYFPRAVANPAISHVAGGAILELEAFGEHTGWGVIPNCRVGEFCDRLTDYRESHAAGLLVRTSWEAISGANALDSLSAVNVYALARLARFDEDKDMLILAWLRDSFGVGGRVAEQVTDLLLRSWTIPAAAYWDDQVFPRHSCLPSTWQEGWMSMETVGMGRRDRPFSIAPNDPRVSEDARKRLFADKAAATALAARLADEARALSPQLPADLARLFVAFAWVEPFARQFELATKATFYAARATAEDLEQLPVLTRELLSLADELAIALAAANGQPHHHSVLFDPAQIRRFAASLAVR